MKNELEQHNKMILFQNRKIRRIWHEHDWFYSVVDVIGALTDSANSRDYWHKMKKRVSDEERAQLSTICRQLKIMSADGKKYSTDCANTEGILRIIQFSSAGVCIISVTAMNIRIGLAFDVIWYQEESYRNLSKLL